MFRSILVLTCLFFCVFSAPPFQKCKLDVACATKIARIFYKPIFEDESYHLIPIHNKVVIGDLETINYKLEDVYTTGFEKCDIRRVNLNVEKGLLEKDMYCPEYHVKGKYDLKGKIHGIPVYGKGDFTAESKGYNVSTKDYLTITKKNNKHYVHINSFDIEAEPLEGVVFNFENLYDGQKEPADKFITYANKEWKEVASLLDGPLFKANYKNIQTATNQYLKDRPLEDFFEL